MEAGSGHVSDGDVPHLIGVACIDFELIATKQQMQAVSNDEWPEFLEAVQTAMKACPARTLSEAQLEQLRAEYSPLSICGTGEEQVRKIPVADEYDARKPNTAAACEAGATGSGLSGAALGGIIGAIGGLVAIGFLLMKVRREHRWRGRAANRERRARASGQPVAPQTATATAVPMGTMPQGMEVAVPVAQGVVLPNRPPLAEMCELFRRDLGAKGPNFVDVTADACRKLGLPTEGVPLMDQANSAYDLIQGQSAL